jgi:virginiamycin B lyase
MGESGGGLPIRSVPPPRMTQPKPLLKGDPVLRPLLRSSVFGILAAALFAACGKGTPLTSGTATPGPPYVPNVSSEFSIPTANSRPMGLTLNPNTGSEIWFTENAASKIGVLTSAGVVGTPEPLTPSKNAGPNGMATGPNNLVWFAETNVGKIGQVTISTPPIVTEFLLTPGARPTSITLGSDGNMWVVDPATSAVWKVSQKGVVGAPCLLPSGADPTSIVTGSDGALWFTEAGIDKIGRLPVTNTAACGTVSQFKVPTTHNAGLATIVSAADGALWFTERNAKKLGRMLVTGHVTNQYSLSPATSPTGLVQGIDNNFYFSDTSSNQIGQFITTTQKVKLFKIPTANAQPGAMILGLDNEVYFVEPGADKLGQFKYFCC